jgi:hypothetical protein
MFVATLLFSSQQFFFLSGSGLNIMAPPKGKRTQEERAAMMLKRMQFAFAKQFPRCVVKLVKKWGQGQAFLEIENVVSYLILPDGTSKIFALDSADISTFLFDNYPQEGDRDRRMKSHDRMWRLFMASPIGQEKIKAWNALPVQTRVRMPPQQMSEKLETGLPLRDEKLKGGIPAGSMVAFGVSEKPRPSRSYNCLMVGDDNRIVKRAIETILVSRIRNRENVIMFSMNSLSKIQRIEFDKRALERKPDPHAFLHVKSPVELIAAVAKIREHEGPGQRLHLIVDSTVFVEYAEPNRELDKCMFALPFRFKNPALKEIADNVEVLTVVVKSPS